MTKDELKNWLRSYREKKLEAADLDRRIKELEADIDNPKTTRFDKLPGSARGAGSPTEQLYVKGVAMVEQYKAKRADLLDGMNQIEEAIAGLNETERLLFRCRYIDGLDWEDVAVAISYSWRQMHTIHSRALNKLSETPRPRKFCNGCKYMIQRDETTPCADCNDCDKWEAAATEANP